jgi:hypothetical protein
MTEYDKGQIPSRPDTTPREVLAKKGVHLKLFGDSAEGVRAPRNREIARDRSSAILRRVFG